MDSLVQSRHKVVALSRHGVKMSNERPPIPTMQARAIEVAELADTTWAVQDMEGYSVDTVTDHTGAHVSWGFIWWRPPAGYFVIGSPPYDSQWRGLSPNGPTGLSWGSTQAARSGWWYNSSGSGMRTGQQGQVRPLSGNWNAARRYIVAGGFVWSHFNGAFQTDYPTHLVSSGRTDPNNDTPVTIPFPDTTIAHDSDPSPGEGWSATFYYNYLIWL